MTAQVQYYLAKCDECLHKKRGVSDKRYKFASTERGYLNQFCQIEIFCPTQPDSSGYRYVLAMEEVYTRYCIFVPLKRITADIVVKAILKRCVAFLGISNEIRTDLGNQFTSALFRELTQQLQIKHDFPTKDYHSGNHAEGAFKIFGELLRTLSAKEKRHWSNFLPILQLAYNVRFHKTLGLSPFCLSHWQEA